MTYEIFNLNYYYYRKFQTRWKRKREGWELEKRKIRVLVYDLNVRYKTFDFIILFFLKKKKKTILWANKNIIQQNKYYIIFMF